MQIITREQWGARYEAGFGPAPLPAREVWLHHSVTAAPDLEPPFDDEDQAMRQLEEIGERRFGRGISYTFAVMPTGRVYEGHGVDREGAHTRGRNATSRAIVLVGNYDVDEPTPEQLEAAAQLLADGWWAGWWAAPGLAGGHRQVPGAATVCPGRYGLASVAQVNRRATAIAAAPISPEDDDMPLTPADYDAIAERVVAFLISPTQTRYNLQAIYNIARAADRRVDIMDDATASQLERIEAKVNKLLGGPSTSTPRLAAVAPEPPAETQTQVF